MTGRDGESVTNVRIIDTPERASVVLARLRDAFTAARVVETLTVDGQPDLVSVTVEVTF